VIDKLQPLNDVNEFIRREKTPELTHRYAYALNMMDLLATEVNGSGNDDPVGGERGGDDAVNNSFEDSEEVGRRYNR
jgi:hypothetical protein